MPQLNAQLTPGAAFSTTDTPGAAFPHALTSGCLTVTALTPAFAARPCTSRLFVKVRSLPATLAVKADVGGDLDWQVRANADGSVGVYSAQYGYSTVSPAGWAAPGWHHLELAFDGAEGGLHGPLYLYWDGRYVGTQDAYANPNASTQTITVFGGGYGSGAVQPADVATGEVSVYSVALHTGGTVGATAFTPPTAPTPDAGNGLAHLYHLNPADGQGGGLDSASQTFAAPTFDSAHPVTISTAGGTDTITVPAAAFAQGTYPLAGYALYEGQSPGAELGTPVATIPGSSGGAFTRPAASGGVNYWRYVRAYDGEPFPAYSPASNEVSSTAGGPLIDRTSTTSRARRAPYPDPSAVGVPSGVISYYKYGAIDGYMDTTPTSTLNDFLGFCLTLDPRDASSATVLGWYYAAGFTRTRLGGSWGSLFDYSNAFTGHDDYVSLLTALKDLGCKRPLLLFDWNNAAPCPMRSVAVNVVTPASQGATSLVVDALNIGLVRPFHSGVGGNPVPTQLITAVSGPDGSGHYTLTVPRGLPSAVPTGAYSLGDLAYSPPGATGTGDAAGQARADATYAAMQSAVTQMAQAAHSVFGQAFDMECGNEVAGLSSAFTDLGRWLGGYSGGNVSYGGASRHPDGSPLTGMNGFRGAMHDALAALGYAGVTTVNGLANESPDEPGSDLLPGEALSRHAYTGGGYQDCSPAHPFANSATWATVDARGGYSGTLDHQDFATIVPGSGFVPTLRAWFPEQWHTFLTATEGVVRDLQPWGDHPVPGGLGVGANGHGRFSQNPADPKAFRYVETENNFDGSALVSQAAAAAGLSINTAPAYDFSDALMGKSVLRSSLFFRGRGQAANYYFCDAGQYGDGNDLGLLPPGYDLTRGPCQVPTVLGRALAFLRQSEAEFGVPRALGVSSVLEYDPQVVFTGGGTSAAPDAYHSDFLALLPYQASARRFVVAAYVAHPDMSKVWDTGRGVLEIERYTMPPQKWDLTLTNVQGTGAAVRLYDPSTDSYDTATVLASTSTSLTVRVYLTDRPRLLEIVEAQDGPTLTALAWGVDAGGVLTASWQSGATVTATGGADTGSRAAQTLSPVGGSVTAPEGVNALRLAAAAGGVTVTAPAYDPDTLLTRAYAGAYAPGTPAPGTLLLNRTPGGRLLLGKTA